MALQSLKRISAGEEVLEVLTRAIQTEEIKVGGFLPAERILAAQLGVSRVVVREAAKVLEQQGWVFIRHGVGIEVTNNPALPVKKTIERILPEDRERLRQCAQSRLLIEPELAALAAVKASASLIKKLQAINKQLTNTEDIATAVDLDLAFHEAISTTANNQVLGLMLESVASIGRLSRAVTIEKVGARKAAIQHQKILTAISSGSPASARSAMKAHLQSAMLDLD